MLEQPSAQYQRPEGKRESDPVFESATTIVYLTKASLSGVIRVSHSVPKGLGLLPGLIEVSNRHGRPQVSVEFNDEKQIVGTVQVWRSDGTLARTAQYAAGVLHGTEETWWPRDRDKRSARTKQRTRIEWVNGKLHGRARIWNVEGQQIVEGFLDQAKPCGLFMVRGWSRRSGLPACPPSWNLDGEP
jgi:hypothetical protein